MRAVRTIETPLGWVRLHSTDGLLTAVGWGAIEESGHDPVLDQAAAELAEYFHSGRVGFSVPLALPDGAFRRRFLRALIDIPFGHTRTYGDLASDLGVSAQAIGQACGANPIPIIVPCHRVLGATSLGGFSARGGVETKVALLRHENAAGLLI